MSWLKHMTKLPAAAGQARRVVSGGGPRRLHLRGIGRPSGLILPVSRLKLELEARNGARARWEPAVPLPFLYSWAYRVSRRLGVPVISSRDPENVHLSVTLPGLRRKGRRPGGR